MEHSLIEKIRKRLTYKLPGEKAQFLMAPPMRKQYAASIIDSEIKPKLSAVLILLYPHQQSLKTVLIQRPLYDGVHSGQIAFPGGKFENNDVDLMNTALRETNEEIGVQLFENNIIGTLSDVYIYPSNFLVKPYIGFISKKIDFMIDSREVEQCIETDVMKLSDSSIIKETTLNYANGLKFKTPYFDIEGFTVWGATAMIISEFNAVLNDL